MSQKENLDALLKIYAAASGQTGKTQEELMAQCDENFHRQCREAEVEEILAWNATNGAPVPGDVTDDEIRAAQMRYKKNTIFRLVGKPASMHGISFTQAARPQVLKKAAAGKPLERDMNALSRSAATNKMLDDLCGHSR